MSIRLATYVGIAFAFLLSAAVVPAWATLPTPNQPILVVQDSSSADPYQNFVPELLTTEGLNGFQTAQLADLTAAFLTNYDVVILPHLTLTSAQATLFSNYVNTGGTLIGFRPGLQLASVFGVASLGTTLSEGWLKIDTGTAYGAGLDSSVMKFHGVADLYSLSGASALATLYNSATLPTSSPAASIYTFGSGKAILFSFDLTQSNVLMRQGNPAWAGYPNNHDGYNTMRASQMFMDQGSGQFWNDLGDGALNGVPQADIQLRLFSNALVLSNSAKRPLPKLWYFPTQGRTVLLFTGDQHGDPVDNSISEINAVQAAGGKFTDFLWDPFGSISSDQVAAWLAAGHAMEIHFNDTAEVDVSGVGGSAASWSGMQSVISTAMTDFAANYPATPLPMTTREHFLIWVSNNAAGTADQTAQAKLFQNAGIQLDTTYSAFPNRWGYMTGSGLPMKFLDATTGTIIPVYEQATQYEDDVQLGIGGYGLSWDVGTAQSHYQQTLSDSLTKYNTVVTMLFHPDHWSDYSNYAQTVLDYAQANSVPMYTTTAWLQFWKARAATTVSMPSFTSNTLTFTATGAPDGLTLLVPNAAGVNNVVSSFTVDGVSQSFTVAPYQGVPYASVVLGAGAHSISVTYIAEGRVLGQISPASAAASTTIQVQNGSTTATVSVAADGTYVIGPFPAGTYTVTPLSSVYAFSPSSRSVTLVASDVTSVNFTATNSITGQTLFTTQTPVVTNASDNTEYEMGTAFTADVLGQITAIRFWKASSESGTHVGKIWSSAGQLLTSVTFSNETSSGWQQQALPTPLDIAAGTYVVSVNTAGTFYVDTVSGLASQVVNGHLSSVVGNNALFGVAGVFPTNTFSNSNYFRDVFFLPGVSTTLTSLTVNPSTVIGGSSSTGTVTLSNPAPAGGVQVTLSSDNAAAVVPSGVTVPEGASGATFPITTLTNFTATANILGSYYGFQTAPLMINALTLSSVSLNPSSLTGGNSTTGTVALNGPAPAGGTVVSLTSDSASATVPANVTVPSGASGATFTVTTSAVNSVTTATVTGSYGGTQSAALTINPAIVFSVSLNPTSITGGFPSIGTVTLTGPAPAGGAVVALFSDNTAASVAPSVTVTEGSTTALFSVNTTTVLSPTLVQVSATYGVTQTANLTIDNAVISTVALNPSEIAGGNSSTATVTLSGPAPAGGAVVTLTSDKLQTSGLEGVYASSALTAGGSIDWASLGPQYSSVPSGTTTPVTGLPGVNATISNATALPLLTLTNCNFGGDCGWYGNFANGANLLYMGGTYYGDTGWWAANGPFTVQFDSPQRGIGMQVMADENGPFSATLCAYNAANTLLGCVPFSGNATSTADGSALFVGLYDDAQEISRVTLDAGGALYPHDFAIGQMFVSSAQRQLLPASVTVPEGAMTADFPVATSAVSATNSVNITTTYGVTQSAVLTVDPAALSTVTVTPPTVIGGASLVGTVTLNGTAPAGGATIVLSADNPPISEVQLVSSTSGLPQDGSITWTDLGPTFTSIPSGTAVPISGMSGVNLTVSTANGLPAMILLNCPEIDGNCGFAGNFPQAAPLLWVGGNYDNNSNWLPNGPMTLTLSTPQHGLGFSIMADEAGPFSGTVCAYNAANTLLGCLPFTGFGAALAGGSNGVAGYVGIYDDTAEIAKVTIDAGGALYPHDFAIGQLFAASSRRMVPSSVKVQAGATTATFPVNTDNVQAVTTVDITGNYLGAHSGVLTVNPPPLSSVAVNPSSVVGGNSVTGTVTLAAAAPGGGALVTLSSDNPAASVPANVIVPQGSTTATFNITTTGVASTTAVTISADYAGFHRTASLTVTSASLASVSMNPSSLTGGTSSTGTVTLTGAAPVGGALVTLLDDSPSATTPASVTVAEGASSATFNVTTVAVGAVTTVTITGNYNGPQSGSLTINPATLVSVSMNPTGVTGGISSTGTVTLSSAAPSTGTVVTLSDDSGSATTPVSVTVAAGATTATFTVTTVAVGTNTAVTISATLSGVTQTATLTVNAPVLSNLTLAPTSVNGGSSSTGTVTLSSAAPAGGAVVTLSDDSASSNTPASVTVAAGATTATFTVTTIAVSSSTTATITGNYNGTKTATLTINAPVLTNLTLNPTALVGGNSSTGTVTLGSIAPAGGATVALSSNSAAAIVPTGVTVAAGATTATFAVTTTGVSAATPATITGTYNAPRTANLTINPATLTSVAMSPAAVTGGVSSTGTVTLTGFAPAGGVTVTLSDNNANATTPASVVVPGGSATATFTVTTIPVTAASTATFTAVFNGVTRTATLTINPPALVSVTMNPVAVTGGTSSTGTVTLDSPALTGGAVVTLSDNSSSTTTPANVTVAAGATSATFTVTSVSVAASTTVTITATRNGVNKTATLILNPPQVVSITLNPTSVVGGLQNSTATVTLNAPAAGSTAQRRVTLTSSNTAAATVPASVTVASGAKTATFTVTSKLVLLSATSTISATMNGATQTAIVTVNP